MGDPPEGAILDWLYGPTRQYPSKRDCSLKGCNISIIMIQETDKKIAEVCTRFPEYPCLLSIPGFGPDISAKVLGASAIPTGLRMHDRCSKRQDSTLSARQKREENGRTPVISKKGKADLRYGLYQAALIASSRNDHFMRYFTK